MHATKMFHVNTQPYLTRCFPKMKYCLDFIEICEILSSMFQSTAIVNYVGKLCSEHLGKGCNLCVYLHTIYLFKLEVNGTTHTQVFAGSGLEVFGRCNFHVVEFIGRIILA